MNSGASATGEDGKMRSFKEWLRDAEIEPTYEERTPMEIAYEAGLREGIEPVAESPAAMAGSTTRLLIEKKIASLKERYSKACDGNDYEEGIKLYAQICLLDNMWLDIIRIEGE